MKVSVFLSIAFCCSVAVAQVSPFDYRDQGRIQFEAQSAYDRYDRETRAILQKNTTVPRTALIPFADETPTEKQIEDEKKHTWASFKKSKRVSDGETVTITMGSSSLAEHLVESHECPEWVAEYYKNDMSLLIRIHKGYEMQGSLDHYSERRFNEIHVNPATRIGTFTPEIIEKDRAYYAKQRKHYSRFKVLKVTEPAANRQCKHDGAYFIAENSLGKFCAECGAKIGE